MRRLVLFAITLLVAAACARNAGLRTGDLVFVGLPLDYDVEGDLSSAISASTGKDGERNLIHVAIAEVDGDDVWIIDATLRHGVDRHPLDTFLTDFTLKDGSLPEMIVRRISGVDAAAAVEKAKSFCGQPYDLQFLPDNGAMYCSELVQESFLDADGKPVFASEPMNWRASDGTIPAYWEWLFGLLDMEVPQGLPGTNPQGEFSSSLLSTVPLPQSWWQERR